MDRFLYDNSLRHERVKGHARIVEIYIVKFNVSILNKTVTKLFTILLTKCFFFLIFTLQANLKVRLTQATGHVCCGTIQYLHKLKN